MNKTNTWAEDFDHHLREAGETARAFAQRTGIPETAVSMYRRGKRGLSPARMREIETATGGAVRARCHTCGEPLAVTGAEQADVDMWAKINAVVSGGDQ